MNADFCQVKRVKLRDIKYIKKIVTKASKSNLVKWVEEWLTYVHWFANVIMIINLKIPLTSLEVEFPNNSSKKCSLFRLQKAVAFGYFILFLWTLNIFCLLVKLLISKSYDFLYLNTPYGIEKYVH